MKQHFYKYRLRNGEFLKDGHTMFLPDVLSDLQRKSFLEENKVEQDARIAQLEQEVKELKRDRYETNMSLGDRIQTLMGKNTGLQINNNQLKAFVELVDYSGVSKTNQEIADALEQLQE